MSADACCGGPGPVRTMLMTELAAAVQFAVMARRAATVEWAATAGWAAATKFPATDISPPTSERR